MVCVFSFNLTFCQIAAASGSMEMTKSETGLVWRLFVAGSFGWLVNAQAFLKPYSVLIQSMKNEPNRL